MRVGHISIARRYSYVNSKSVATGFELNGTNAISFPTGDTTAGASVTVGAGALLNETAGGSAAYSNTAVIGSNTYCCPSTTTTATIDNVGVGQDAFHSLTSGYDNVVLGRSAGYGMTSNYENVVILGSPGTASCCSIGIIGLNNTTGSYNVGVGWNAGSAITSGQYEVALGVSALNGGTTITGSGNTGVGTGALYKSASTAANDTGLGENALSLLTTGNNNTVLGYQVASTVLTTGSGNILIGTSNTVTTAAAGTSNFVSIGNLYEGSASIDHIVFHGTAPTTFTTCGTGAALSGNDNVGKMTIGTTPGASCAITFKHAWTTAPVCFAQNRTTGNILKSSSSTTKLTMTGTLTASDVISYDCAGYQL